MTGLKIAVAAGVAVASGASGLVVASQQIIAPDTTAIPMSATLALVTCAITATAVVMRFVFKVDRKLDDLSRGQKDLWKRIRELEQ